MKYSVNGDLSVKEIGGELFIYNRKNSTIYSFNGVGVFIWNQVSKNMAPEEIGRHLCEEYDVTPAEAQNDVSDFVKNLGDNGLITFQPE